MTFVGRERELGRLGAALERAAEGRLARVAVLGSTGTGASHLLSELERRLADEPEVVVARGAASEPTAGHPYAALTAALRRPLSALPDDRLLDVVGTAGYDVSLLLPQLADRLRRLGAVPDAPLLSAPDQRGSRILETVLGVLARLAGSGAVLLALDDLHWADPGTRAFVQAVLRVSLPLPLCLVVAYHSDELHRGHPFLRLATQLGGDPAVERIQLLPLGRDELVRLMEAEMGERPSAGLVAAIAERSEGNPLVAVQLLDARRSVPALRLSDSFEEIVQARLAVLSLAAVRCLRVLAAVRRPVDPDMLLAIDVGEGRLSSAGLNEAVDSGLASRTGAGVAIAQGLYAEVIESFLDPIQRHRIHATLAATLAGSPAECAWHWEMARREDEAAAAHLAAGEAAEALDPGETALQHYLRALELGAGAGPGPAPGLRAAPAAEAEDTVAAAWAGAEPDASRRRIEGSDRPAILARAAQAAFVGGAFRRAAELAGQAIRARVDRDALAAGSRGSRPARDRRALELALLYERLARYRWAAGELDAGLASFQTAVELAPPSPSADLARVQAALAQALMLDGRYTESAAYARRAVETAGPLGDEALAELGHATCTLGVDAAYGGDLETGLRLVREAGEIARRAGRLDDLMRAYANQTTILDLDSRREEALAVVEQGITEARRWGQEAVYGAFLRGNAADCLFFLGRWPESEAMCRQALEWSPSGVSWFNPLVGLALVKVESAADEEAGSVLGQLLLQLETVPDSQWTATVQRASVSFALWREDVADAGRAVTRGWERVLRTDDWSQVAMAASTAIEVFAAVAEAARARRDASAVADVGRQADDVLAEAERRVAACSLPPTLGARREAELHLATARAHRDRLRGQPRVDAWAEIADAWLAVPVPYLAARARWWEAEAALRTRADRPGARADRARARVALLQAWELADMLAARPLQRELVRLASRARIALPRLDAELEAATFPRAAVETEVEVAAPVEANGRGDGTGAAQDLESVPASPIPRAGRDDEAGGSTTPPVSPGSGLAGRIAASQPAQRQDAFNLSPRETEVLTVLAEGRTNREIARRLFISERTVAVHVGNILNKLGVSGRVEAATVALRLGLVPALSRSAREAGTRDRTSP